MAFNMFPWTNLHNLNTDWILKTIKDLKTAAEQAASTVAGYATRLTALEKSRVSYAAEQQLTRDQQIIARGNIGAAPAIGVVYYNEAQALSSDYKAQARENIGAAAAGDIPVVTGVVHYDEAQSLTNMQKQTARTNIGALSEADVAGSVKYNAQQRLTIEQQATARGNISAAPNIGVVYYNEAQSLSDAYKTQARNNIGAAAAGDIPVVTGFVRYDGAQSLTAAQQTVARKNIGAVAPGDIPVVTGFVRYDGAQSLTAAQQTVARKNIGAVAPGDIPALTGFVRYNGAQSLTIPQKEQARNNIGAMPADTDLPLEVNISYDNGYSMDQDMDDILNAIENSVPVVITCEEVSSWPGFTSFTNLRNVSITQLRVIRSGSSDDFNIVGDALLAFDETTLKLQILHLSLSLLSGSTSIYPTIWGMLGAPLATAQDIGKWLTVDSNGYPVWATLPVYQGGVS